MVQPSMGAKSSEHSVLTELGGPSLLRGQAGVQVADRDMLNVDRHVAEDISV